jgi:hypothetical protein
MAAPPAIPNHLTTNEPGADKTLGLLLKNNKDAIAANMSRVVIRAQEFMKAQKKRKKLRKS